MQLQTIYREGFGGGGVMAGNGLKFVEALDVDNLLPPDESGVCAAPDFTTVADCRCRPFGFFA